MARWLKRGRDAGAVAEDDAKVRAAVERILADIAGPRRRGGARAVGQVRQVGPRRLPAHRRRDRRLPVAAHRPATSRTSRFAQAQVRNFAQHQRAALRDVEVETLPGVVLGHKNIPVELGRLLRAGRQVPAARPRRTCRSSPPRSRACRASSPARRRIKGRPAPAIVAAQHLAGADEIYCLGGVQAVGAMALGTEAIAAVDMLVGPGQRLRRRGQAAALRPRRHRPLRRPDRDPGHRRRDRRRRDLRHRPARPGRARPDSPAILLTTSEKLARDTMAEVERLLAILPTAAIARQAWEDYGEVIVCDSRRGDGARRPTGSPPSTSRS